jgi:Flp pilus assembly protein protease CpaA
MSLFILSDVIHTILYLVLAVVAYIDQRTYRIPNMAIVTIVVLAGVNAVIGELIYPVSALFLSIVLSILPIIMGYILGRAVHFGWGDIKLMGGCALFIPPDDVGKFIMGIGLLSILHRWVFRKIPIPFAPAIATSFVLIKMVGPSIAPWVMA